MSKITEKVVRKLFDDASKGVSPEELSQFFSEEVDFFVAGDTEHVSWIGKKNGRKEVASFYSQLSELINSQKFQIDDILIKGTRAVVLGQLVSEVKKTGKIIETEFAYDIVVEQEQITRFRMFEDSFAVSEAVK